MARRVFTEEFKREAVRHYSALDEARSYTGADGPLRALQLTAEEINDWVAFLETLTDVYGADQPVPAGCE